MEYNEFRKEALKIVKVLGRELDELEGRRRMYIDELCKLDKDDARIMNTIDRTKEISDRERSLRQKIGHLSEALDISCAFDENRKRSYFLKEDTPD